MLFEYRAKWSEPNALGCAKRKGSSAQWKGRLVGATVQSEKSYAASREAEAQSENKVLVSQIQALKQILSSRVGQDTSIDFKSLFRVPDERELNKDETLRLPEKPVLSSYLPKSPNTFVRWIPGVYGIISA